jgi:hypothetical protein
VRVIASKGRGDVEYLEGPFVAEIPRLAQVGFFLFEIMGTVKIGCTAYKIEDCR